MFKGKKFLLAVSILVLSLVVIACADGNGDSDNDAAGSDRDILRVGVGSNVNNMDIHGTNDSASSLIHLHIFETLTRHDTEFNVYPGLATDWEMLESTEDGDLWQFNLQEGVYFQNGEPMTAHDVAFSLIRGAGAPHVAPIIGMIDPDSIEVIDDHTINIGTSIPFAPLLDHLAHPASSIISEAVVGDVAVGQANVDPYIVGTGPYILEELVTDSHILLVRWDDYHGDAPNIREIHIDINVDPQSRLMSLEAGEVDLIQGPLLSDLDRLRDSDDMTLVEIPSAQVEYMGMNFNHDVLGIPEVRMAINYAIDTAEVVRVSTEETAQPLTGPLPPNVFGYVAGPNYGFDADRARELMEEAGYEDGFEMELLVAMGGTTRINAAQIIQAMLSEINITVNIQQVEWAAFLAALDGNNFDAYLGGWGIVTGDADYLMYPVFLSDNAPESNRLFVDNPEIDALIHQSREGTEEERLEVYAELLDLIHEEASRVWLQNPQLFIGLRSNVSGFDISPVQNHWLGDIYFTD